MSRIEPARRGRRRGRGRLQQFASPTELYDRPVNVFVAGFIGSPAMNIMTVPMDGGARVAGETVALPDPARHDATGLGPKEITIGFRPEALDVAAPGDGLPAQIDVVEELGSDAYSLLPPARPGGDARRRPLTRAHRRAPGRQGGLRMHVDDVHVFDPRSGVRLGD